MTSRVLIILIILVGLGVSGFFIFQNNPQPGEEPRGETETEIVGEISPKEEKIGEEAAEKEAVGEEEAETPSEELPEEKERIENGGQAEAKTIKDLVLLKKEGYIIGGTSSCTIKVGSEYWLYTGTSLFVSQDGLNFEERRTALIYDETLNRTGNPSVIRLKDGRYRMFYEGEKFSEQKSDRKLYSAVSFDGMIWQKEGLRYEDASDSGKPGEMMVSVPEVVRIDDKLYLYYTRGITLAVAVSEDEGMTWQKIKDIVFEGIEIAMDPDLIEIGDGYKLFFTTADNPDLLKATKTWITDASSWDGINFELDGNFKLEADPGKNNAVDADVVYLGEGRYRMYYGQAVEHFGIDYGLYSAILEEEN